MSHSASHIIETLSADQEIWFISDLHLGDGTPSDVFFGKDKHLIALLNRVERDDAILVINGDAMDFHQAWTFTRIMRAHQELLHSMSRLSREGRLYYLIGNHDHDISLYREILNFRVCEELHIGDNILVQHGYQYDPYIGDNLSSSHTATKIHHLVERYFNTWVRIPLAEFYTRGNRLLFWMAHKVAITMMITAGLLDKFGLPEAKERLFEHLAFWARANSGDPMCMFRGVWARLQSDRWKHIVCGHSHLPGIVPIDGRSYLNSGSWTFSNAQYLRWDGSSFECRDWVTGATFNDELYQANLDGSLDELNFFTWWHENYLGWFRFREGEERRGKIRAWEAHIRGHQRQHGLTPLKDNRQKSNTKIAKQSHTE